MNIVINSRKDTKKTINQKLKKLEEKKKSFDIKKITSPFIWNGDALAVQKQMRNE